MQISLCLCTHEVEYSTNPTLNLLFDNFDCIIYKILSEVCVCQTFGKTITKKEEKTMRVFGQNQIFQ